MKRFIIKLIFHSCKVFLKVLDGRFSRLYMKLYNALLNMMGVKLDGAPRYISTSVRFDDFDKITLSERVVISEKVILLTHDYSVTTGLVALNRTPASDVAFIKEIVIKRNVFVGMGVTIMPGTVINENVIIGAGSVVRGKIPENSIVIGNPATVIGSLTDRAAKWELQLKGGHVRID